MTSTATSVGGGAYTPVAEFAAVANPAVFGNDSADATAHLQGLLDQGGHVYVPGGTYRITAALLIGSGTKLTLAPDATVKRSAAINNMIRNDGDGVTGAYGQSSRITIEGGTWDANLSAFPSNCTAIAFGHAEHVAVLDCTVRNVHAWHFIELSACRYATIRGVTCRDYGAASGGEMIQLDIASAGGFPWFGPYDNTPCTDVLVTGCTLVNGDRGIGSHSTAAGSPHARVKVIGNEFRTFRNQGVEFYEYTDSVVAGNTFVDCVFGIRWRADTNQCEGLVVSGNTFDDMRPATNGSRAILFDGFSVAARLLRGISVSGNTVRECRSHAIGFNLCQGVTVTGNTVSGVTDGAGIWTWRTTRTTITGNVCYGNAASTAGQADISVGQRTGTSSEHTDTIVTGNVVDTVAINQCQRTIVTGNVIGTSYTVDTAPSTPTVQYYANHVAGSWVP